MAERRVAVVTGAGSGIGRAVTRALLDAGFRVVAAGRRAETLQATLGARAGRDAIAVPADVTDPASVDALFATTQARMGRVDVLFNNAGTFGPSAPFGDYPLAAWDDVVATNLTGAFLCARAAFRAMRDQSPRGGRIVNNGSLSAHTPRPNAAAYTATKHALTGLTKTIALDGRAYGIACGQIDIGNAATSMTAALGEPTIDVAHAARAVVQMASLPLEANVLSMTVMASAMPFVGRG